MRFLLLAYYEIEVPTSRRRSALSLGRFVFPLCFIISGLE